MKVQTIKRGEKITGSGVYAMPIDWYHDDCCDGPSISSTGIRQVLDCPAKYWDTSYLNPEADRPAQSRNLSFGKAAHSILIEGVLPRNEYILQPFDNYASNDGHKGEFVRGRRVYKNRLDYKRDWKIRAEALGLTIVTVKDIETIMAMYRQIKDYPLVQAGGLQGHIEMAIIWKDPETGVYVKARPDVLPLDGMYLDYKTTEDASERGSSGSIRRYRYDIQIGVTALCLLKVVGVVMTNAALLFQEKTRPFIVSHRELSDAYIACGMKEAMDGVKIFARCLEAGEWPGYPNDGGVLHPPQHIIDQAFGPEGVDLSILEA